MDIFEGTGNAEGADVGGASVHPVG